jgi:hypothetical protein
MADAAAQTRSPQTVYASFTIRQERTTVIGLDKRAGSIAAERPRCYRPTLRLLVTVDQYQGDRKSVVSGTPETWIFVGSD